MYCLVNIPEFILKENYTGYRNLKDVGMNNGNCLFWESTKNILRKQHLNLLSIQEYKKNLEYYQNKISKVVYAHANLIRNYNPGCMSPWEANSVRSMIENDLRIMTQLKCRKYVISIGAQSKKLEYFDFTKEQKADLMSYFAQFEVVYLRGQYTYGLLEHNGIPLTHMACVGCPSLLLRPIELDNLRSKLDTIKQLGLSDINIGISMGGMIKRKDLSNNFINLMADKTIYTLVQAPQAWVDFVYRKLRYPPIELWRSMINPISWWLKWEIAKNANNFVFDDNYSKLIDFFKRNAHCMITTRIHATILGTVAGIPSLCLVIDTRTYELCEQMGIPYVNCINKPLSFNNKEELLQIFLENCIYTDKMSQTIENMKQKYAIFSEPE